MTHTNLGIDEATFAASLRIIGHPWRAGQKCTSFWQVERGDGTRSWECWVAQRLFDKEEHEHEVPIPAITDKLLMRMLREGLKQDIGFLDRVNKLKFGARHWCAGSLSADDRPSSCGFDENHKDHDFSYITANTFEAAIIRATAALTKEG